MPTDIDTSSLSVNYAEDRSIINRDYIAHCLRWTFCLQRIQKRTFFRTCKVLDIGCGIDLPLAKLLYTNRKKPISYVGVDYNRQTGLNKTLEAFHFGNFPIEVFGRIDFSNSLDFNTKDHLMFIGPEQKQFALPNFITCLEVLEHVAPNKTRKILKRIHSLLIKNYIFSENDEKGLAIISTPCYSSTVGAAANHPNEITREALGALLEDIGFKIEENYGTFASKRDYQKALLEKYGPVGKQIFEDSEKYYDWNYLATIYAPLFPECSRNNIWVISPVYLDDEYVRKFPPLSEVTTPWTSSENWLELNGC